MLTIEQALASIVIISGIDARLWAGLSHLGVLVRGCDDQAVKTLEKTTGCWYNTAEHAFLSLALGH